MKTLIKLLTLFLFIIPLHSNAQKEGNVWYFGQNAGVDFNGATPVALTDGSMWTTEGCATIADENGQLLFYTDGSTVWNKNHIPMANGTGLKGNASSSQSAVVIKKPSSINKYIIFTVSIASSPDGLKYSEVDMSLNSGLGDVNSIKNVNVTSSTCEKITVIEHQNEKDFWLITQLHGATENKLQTYLFTKDGITSTPIVSNIGPKITKLLNTLGYLKGSSDGSHLVSANTNKGTVELFDFNNSTGVISNLKTLGNFTNNKCYGIEFSPDNQFLYVAETNKGAELYQFDITSNNEATINASRVAIGSFDGFFGAIQLAPDNKIYVARYNEEELGVINSPNSKGLACNYVSLGLDLKGKKCLIGLPTFYNSIIEPLANLKFDDKCYGQSTSFELTSNVTFDSIRWNFGDFTSSNNSSILEKPFHTYTDSGWHYVTVIISYPKITDTILDSVYIYRLPDIDLGNDTTLCEDESFELRINEPDLDFVWHDNSEENWYFVNAPGYYKVQYSKGKCKNRDSILVDYKVIPIIDLGEDTFICRGDEITLSAQSPNANSYEWSDNTPGNSRTISKAGTYTLQARNGRCVGRDSIVIEEKYVPNIELGEDTLFCLGDSIIIRVSPFNNTLIWNTGSIDSTIIARKEGWYKVTIEADVCSVSDSIYIRESHTPSFDLKKDSILCIGKINKLNIGCIDCEYLWSDGSTDSTFEVANPGIYWASALNSCGSHSDTVVVREKDCTCYLQIANSFTPNNDNLNETFSPTYLSCQFRDYRFEVYNLWGERLFQSKNQNEKWDGTYKNKVVQNGTYVYILDYIDQDGIRQTKKGTVTLIR